MSTHFKNKETGVVVTARRLADDDEVVEKTHPHGTFTFGPGDVEVQHGTETHHYSQADFDKRYQPAKPEEVKAAGF